MTDSQTDVNCILDQVGEEWQIPHVHSKRCKCKHYSQLPLKETLRRLAAFTASTDVSTNTEKSLTANTRKLHDGSPVQRVQFIHSAEPRQTPDRAGTSPIHLDANQRISIGHLEQSAVFRHSHTAACVSARSGMAVSRPSTAACRV